VSEARVRAWLGDARALTAAHVDAALLVLSSQERARHDRLALAPDRRDYVASRALLRLALGAHLGSSPDAIEIGADAHGRPSVAAAPHVSVSVTRARGIVACAVATGCTVGIDLEAVDGRVRALDVARDCFCPEEAAVLAACRDEERPARFCQLWALKESLLKAIGTGLGWPLSCASFDVRDRRVRITHLPTFAAARWAFLVADVGDSHKLAIAVGESPTAARAGGGPRSV
jgi:4'-phosphopantetheinyl transferase